MSVKWMGEIRRAYTILVGKS